MSPLLLAHELVPPLRVVRDVERVVVGRPVRVRAALDHEGVRLAADHRDLGDEEAVDVPGDAPADVACIGMEREKDGFSRLCFNLFYNLA